MVDDAHGVELRGDPDPSWLPGADERPVVGGALDARIPARDPPVRGEPDADEDVAGAARVEGERGRADPAHARAAARAGEAGRVAQLVDGPVRVAVHEPEELQAA